MLYLCCMMGWGKGHKDWGRGVTRRLRFPRYIKLFVIKWDVCLMSSPDYLLFDSGWVVIEATANSCRKDVISPSTLGEDSHLEFGNTEEVGMILSDTVGSCVYSFWMLKHGPHVVASAYNDFGVYSVASMGVCCIP